MTFNIRESDEKSAKHVPALSFAIFLPAKADFVEADSDKRRGDSIRQLPDR